jgi:phosphotransferase system IIA component
MNALGLVSDLGRESFIHVRFDAIKLKGESFEVLVSEVDRVEEGQTLLDVDMDLTKENVPSINITPMCLQTFSVQRKCSY